MNGPGGRWPVAVGGLGGSGTRAVAELLRLAGVYLGADLNEALDNRWFTLLFKRPRWYLSARDAGGEPVRRALAVFDGVMTRGGVAALRSLPLVLGAAVDLSRSGHDPSGFAKGAWPYRRVASMLLARPRRASAPTGWGWKEPNTHVLLGELVEQFPALRYVHVVRHGLDMAFSANQNQLHNWGGLFGVEPPTDTGSVARASLNFWIRANERAVGIGESRLGSRFLVVDADRLCEDPDAGVAHLLDFLQVEVSPDVRDAMVAVPRRPASAGRYRGHDLGLFGPEQIEAVRRLGFAVET